MKNIFFLAIIIFLSSESFSQSGAQQLKIDSVKNIVVDLFNKKDADGLYSMAGAAFRNQCPARFAPGCAAVIVIAGTGKGKSRTSIRKRPAPRALPGALLQGFGK